jgi:DNA-binding CsgD family transcriptional regulator
MLCLAASLYFTVRLPKERTENETLSPESLSRFSVRKPFTLLCLFILTITLTSGLMFQVVNPAFAHLTVLTSWYWAVPYIVSVIVVARLPKTINRGYILYIALAMIGFGFLMFMLLDNSAKSYLIVNTLLLSAFGIMDLFWWSILGEMLDYHQNPSRVFGIGLSVNVAGVLFGELISKGLSFAGIDNTPTIVSFGAVFIALMVLPILQKNFSVVLKNNSFFYSLETMPPEKQKATVEKFLLISTLTEREREVTSLLLKGYTNHMIASELFISENTLKTHMQNIYNKYNVHNKTDLIYKLTK